MIILITIPILTVSLAAECNVLTGNLFKLRKIILILGMIKNKIVYVFVCLNIMQAEESLSISSRNLSKE